MPHHDNSVIEVVRGRLDPARSNELLSFWSARGVLSGEAATRRLPEVVAVLRHGGRIAGASSVYASEVEMIGGRRFWIYRSLLDPAVAEQSPAMIRATFTALQAEFDASAESPIGLCILIADPQERRRRPQLEWSNPRTLYAGYLADGRQVRVAYFKDAHVAAPGDLPEGAVVGDWQPSRALPAGFRVEPFAEQQRVGSEQVIDLWTREGALTADEAQRRVSELVVVATDADGALAGVTTAYLRRDDRLGAELWQMRGFVAPEYQRSGVGFDLGITTIEYLDERYRSGADRRGIGILLSIENEMLKRYFPGAIWPTLPCVFIGESARGDHLRVHYFDGALAPEPG